MVINTLNESSLHKSLKDLYSLQDGSVKEAEVEGAIHDIVLKDGGIIEIQTKNLAKMLPKAMKAIERGKNFTVVHPIIQEKTIETYTGDGKLVSKRKSPVKESVYSVFRELTALYPVLLEDNFSLELVFASVTEKRIKTETPEQSKNGRRRFKKDWQKSDKVLDEIIQIKKLKSRKDYIALLPFQKEDAEFTANDVAEHIKKLPHQKSSARNNASLMLWVFTRMEIIEKTGKKGRANTYRIKI